VTLSEGAPGSGELDERVRLGDAPVVDFEVLDTQRVWRNLVTWIDWRKEMGKTQGKESNVVIVLLPRESRTCTRASI